MSTLRRRLDVELVRRKLVTSRAEAQQAIADGLVTIDGAPALKAGTQVSPAQSVSVKQPPRRFASRGGEKLAHALRAFSLDVTGRVCLDAGASTGGFTDVLLQHGAAEVWAFDVGYGQIHERLRQDPRVHVRERINVRDITAEHLEGVQPDVLVADLSFVSLTKVLKPLTNVLAEHAVGVLLIKPQFEAGRADVQRGGVVRDPDVWRRVIDEVVAYAATLNWHTQNVTVSPITGPAGNVEFLAHMSTDSPSDAVRNACQTAIEQALAAGHTLQAHA